MEVSRKTLFMMFILLYFGLSWTHLLLLGFMYYLYLKVQTLRNNQESSADNEAHRRRASSVVPLPVEPALAGDHSSIRMRRRGSSAASTGTG